jgi:hypothetical protein
VKRRIGCDGISGHGGCDNAGEKGVGDVVA